MAVNKADSQYFCGLGQDKNLSGNTQFAPLKNGDNNSVSKSCLKD